MRFGLKKLVRGAKKIARKNRGGIGRLVKKVGPGLAMAAVGATAPALLVKAASTAKTLGKKVRGIETPKSLATVVKAAQVRVKRTRSKMPGGAPMPSMPTISTPSVGMMASRAVGAQKSLYKKKRAPRKRANGLTPGGSTPSTAKKKRKITAAPSAKQLAARKKFAEMAAARRKKAA